MCFFVQFMMFMCFFVQFMMFMCFFVQFMMFMCFFVQFMMFMCFFVQFMMFMCLFGSVYDVYVSFSLQLFLHLLLFMPSGGCFWVDFLRLLYIIDGVDPIDHRQFEGVTLQAP